MRLKYTTGLDADQFDEVVARVEELLPEPWHKPRGRKRKLSLADVVALTVSYLRQNSIQDVLGERWRVSPKRVSALTSYLTPLVETAREEFLPTEQDAADAVRDRVCLLEGSLGPCWSWREHDELWTRTQGTTGHNFHVITNLAGEVRYVSDPVLGSVHDSVAIHVTPVARILTKSGGVIADKGCPGCGYWRRVRSRRAASSVCATSGRTRMFCVSARRSSAPWLTSRHDGSSTLTTGGRYAPT